MIPPILVNPASAINVTLSATSQAIAGVVPGQKYLCTSTVDAFFNIAAAAVANQGLYLPAKVPLLLIFGDVVGAGSAAPSAPDLRVVGSAGALVMTPVSVR
jgi:hypothetical protein